MFYDEHKALTVYVYNLKLNNYISISNALLKWLLESMIKKVWETNFFKYSVTKFISMQQFSNLAMSYNYYLYLI